MHDDATAAVQQETGTLIDHILTNSHQMHRADLASLVPLAKRSEHVHADDPDAAKGLARALAMRAGGGTGIEQLIAAMRADHDDLSAAA